MLKKVRGLLLERELELGQSCSATTTTGALQSAILTCMMMIMGPPGAGVVIWPVVSGYRPRVKSSWGADLMR